MQFATIWVHSATTYFIDKFQNLAIISSSDTALSSACASTRILITDASKTGAGLPDCRIKPPTYHVASINLPTVDTTVDVETTEKFATAGAACGTRSNFKLKAYARFEDGSLLHPRYAKAAISGGDILQVFLKPDTDTNS